MMCYSRNAGGFITVTTVGNNDGGVEKLEMENSSGEKDPMI